MKEAVSEMKRQRTASGHEDPYELKTVTRGGVEILIRSIRSEEGSLIVDLFHSLSPDSVRLRFLGHIKELSPNILEQLTRIDQEHDVGLLALECTGHGEGKALGVCHLFRDRNRPGAEFSIMVGDVWHGKGVGAKLLECCLAIARERGIESIWGLVSPENTNMLALARKLGMTIRRVAGSREYRLEMDINALPNELRHSS